ncbi:MAG: TerC family protein [Desulfurispora sp.]|uniref:TerC family protein n=1 Tax=Desulfurispora sp. TaxID=3014275 RepID=UPI00404A2730
MEFILSLLSIILIDIVLGGDNAVVIAMASKSLPPQLRKKAILLGTAGAIAVRVLLTAFVIYLLAIPLLQFVGGLLLIWIAWKLLADNNQKEVTCRSGKGLWDALKIIIMADLVMGVDNILAIAGAARGHVGLVLFGLVISIPLIVWGSTLLVRLMDRFSAITYVGAGVIAWAAGHMIAADPIVAGRVIPYLPHFEYLAPLTCVVLVTGYGWYKNRLAGQVYKANDNV